MNILFDGDLLVYRMCKACEERSPFDKTILIKADPEDTWKCIQMRIDQCVFQVMEYFDIYQDDITITICFSHKDNFRKKVNPDYKSNRTDEKPELYADMVAKAKRLYDYEEWPNIEADDVMGILQGNDTVICTGDKDLLQVPGYHLNLIYPEDGVTTMTQDEALIVFQTQCLTGDTTDGYYGCPNIGPEKAKELLIACPKGKEWEMTVNTYKQAKSPKTKSTKLPNGKRRVIKLVSKNLGLGYNEALMTARMAYILQTAEDYNRETGEVTLWEP